MTEAKIKALFAKHDHLRLSVQGMKTQQGYLRDAQKKLEQRVTPLEERLPPILKEIDNLQFGNKLLFTTIAFFYGTLILGWLLR